MMEQIATTIYFSLLIGITLLVIFLCLSATAIIREIGVWISWCYDIKQLRSLPSPPLKHWIWGHAAEVGFIIMLIGIRGKVKRKLLRCTLDFGLEITQASAVV